MWRWNSLLAILLFCSGCATNETRLWHEKNPLEYSQQCKEAKGCRSDYRRGKAYAWCPEINDASEACKQQLLDYEKAKQECHLYAMQIMGVQSNPSSNEKLAKAATDAADTALSVLFIPYFAIRSTVGNRKSSGPDEATKAMRDCLEAKGFGYYE
jgi:hypothetical protein